MTSAQRHRQMIQSQILNNSPEEVDTYKHQQQNSSYYSISWFNSF